jgi:mannose-1-phosphate guanylyltransferase
MTELFGPIADLRPSGDEGGRYAIVLAGGSGTRLGDVAEKLYGYARPKQYCRFGSGRTLLEETLWRAARFTGSQERIAVSLSREHRAEANECLAGWPDVMRVEQPRNLDTTPGILLPLLQILTRDPWATVLVLPSDHHVSDDEPFVDAFLKALQGLDDDPDAVALAGARLAEPGLDLGWIVPGPREARWRRVEAFVEKPSWDDAVALHGAGALANTFAFVGRGSALARMGRRYAFRWWRALTRAFFDPLAVEQVYRSLPPSSFSRDVLQPAAPSLGVVPLEGVDWSDVGTPERLAAVRDLPLISQVA